ncbi:MAG TPA: alpha/beta fold hydrolase [Stellaceae bacterium]|nr:alpha/beta fold hydrolase [Stellaceae bacterium]
MWRKPLIWSIVVGATVGLGVLGLLVALPGKSSRAPPAPIATTPAPVKPNAIEDVACWFPIPSQRQVRCGVLTVPEQWNVAQPARYLHLKFVVFRSAARDPAEPMLYISGGPGEPALIDSASIAHWWHWIDREAWLKTRDLVVFDQRGVGLSEPPMECPELAAAAYRVFGAALSLTESDAIWAGAAAVCHKRLIGAGIDLSSYNTQAIAADIRALIAGLGMRAPILLATSYGTRVALRLAEEPGLALHAMILDSVDPPDVAEYVDGAPSAAHAFAQLFGECAEDPTCRASFPNLSGDFERLVRQAAAAPIPVELADPRGGKLSVRLDDSKLIEVLFYAFYDWRRIEELPAIIEALGAGDSKAVEPLLRVAFENYVAAGVGHGLFLSVECHDEFPFNSREAVEKGSAGSPLFRNFALSTLPLAVCASWPVGKASNAERAPAGSNVPTLMLSGALDPVTPPSWAAQAAAHLPHAYDFTFRGVGHGVLAGQACASRIVSRFLADPKRAPADDCLLALGPPHFRKGADLRSAVGGSPKGASAQ